MSKPDHVDFQFTCSHSGLSIPSWDNGGPYVGRATRGFIEEVCGPLRMNEHLDEAFDRCALPTAREVAETKLKLANGVYDPPIVVDAGDVPTL